MGKRVNTCKRSRTRIVLVSTGLAIWMMAGWGWILTADDDHIGIGTGERPTVVADGDGGALVVWEGPGEEVQAQRIDAAGELEGGTIALSEMDTALKNPAVANLGPGEFVVAWEAGDREIAGVRLSATGDEQLFRIGGRSPVIGADDQGNFVVAWTAPALPDNASGHPAGNHLHFARRFAAGGHPVGVDFRFGPRGLATPPALAVAPTGEFLVAWEDNSRDIRGIVVSSGGHPVGVDFRINATREGRQIAPVATVPLDGHFTVVWERQLPDSKEHELYGRRVSSGGHPVGVDFRLNVNPSSGALDPAIASDAWGRTLVTWTHQGAGTSEIRSRQLDLTGAPIGPEMMIALPQAAASQLTASSNESDFFVVWESISANEKAVVGRFIQVPVVLKDDEE